MMAWIVSTALRHRVVATALAAVLLVVGFQVVRETPFDVFPEFAPVLVEIQTEAPGLSTEEVESLVTVPIESAVNGISWLEIIRSKSVLGLSSVVLYFEDGTDLWEARQVVQERVAAVTRTLPSVARPPVILPPLSATSRVLKIGLTSSALSQVDLTTLALWTIRPRLMAVPGVANVAIWGQRERQLQALVDPDKLRAHDVTLDQIVQATSDALYLGAGGFVDTTNQRMGVMQVQAILEPRDLAQVVVAFRGGAPLLLADVATVVEGHPAPIGDAVINDGPGLLLIVEKQPWGNTFDVTTQVEAALEALRPGLGDVQIDSTIFRPATFIEMALENLSFALLLGCLLVVAVLLLFLFEWRTALISIVAIPLSLVAAALVLQSRGGTINTMILAGLIIALGEVVDDAIIDVENIMRRLRLNEAAGRPESVFRVVLDASLEVRSAVVYGSMIVVLVFLPVFFLEGLSGSFFRPLAFSYVLAILASLLVALTVTPALSLLLLPKAARRRGDSPLVRLLRAGYRKILPAVLSRSRWAIPVILAGLLVCAAVYPLLGEQFLPDFKEFDFLMHWVEKPGTSIEAMQRVTVRVSKELRSIPGVRNFGAHIGRAEVADEIVGPNFTELWISLDSQADYDQAVASIRRTIDGYPGLFRDVLTYLKERIKEVLTGASATLVVRIYGPELEVLRSQAAAVAEVMGGIEGVADLHVEPQVLVPQVVVKVRLDGAQRFGLTPGDVRRTATTLIQGTKVGQIYEEQKIFDVVVWGQPELRSDVARLRESWIATPAGGYVRLGEVADVYVAPTPNIIQREGASRRIDVTCNIRSRDQGAVVRRIEQGVGGVGFERGYHPEILGEFAEQRRSRNRLLELSALSVLGIVLILYSDFRSARLTAIVFLSLPFALFGGVLATLASGGVISLGSLVGFVTVLGIAARNGIMLVSHYRHLRVREGQAFGTDLVVRGTEERLAPILMTALTTVLALVPIALRGNRPGQEIEHPMSLVIIGGLVTSTLLNLLIVPALYHRFGEPTELPAEGD
jgi:CzcA family heavy metal efflux pump